MRLSFTRARLRLAASPAAQFWVLWGFFFCAETASYLLGVLSSTVLVKRAGAARLPEAYLMLNAFFLPVVLLVLARPPRSSFRAVRASVGVYLLATMVTLPAADSTSAGVLMVMYVVARLGKLIWSTFAVGMVAEILPLREAKAATPSLLAAASAGIVIAGIALRWTLAAVGIQTAFFALWVLLAAAYALLVLLEPSVAARTPSSAPPPRRSLGKTLRHLLSIPLARVIGIQNLFVVGMRYFVEFVYAGSLASHFATERDMAGFTGVFEATLQVSTAAVQFALTGPLMRTLGIGGVALMMPAMLVVVTGAATVWDAFPVVLACQFLFWVGSDGFNKPVRQVMVGALPQESAASVPVLMAALGMAGSIAASTLLVPLARLGSPQVVMAGTCLMSLVFLALSFTVGKTYRTTLWQTLKSLDASERARVLGGEGIEAQDVRYAAVTAMLESPEPEIRFQAAREAQELHGPHAAAALLRHAHDEPDPKVRSALLSTLAALRPEGAHHLLERALGDPDARVRATALEALAGYRDEPALLPALDSALGSADARERAAAVIGAVRVGSSRDLLGRALDVLAAMLLDRGDVRARAAAAFAMGQLGYPFLLPALDELLRDPELPVRRAAVEALIQSHSALSLPLLAGALESEPDAGLAARILQAAEGLRDENVRSILDVAGHLTGAERAQVSQMLAKSPGDRKLALLRDAVLIGRTRSRSALVELVHQTHDEPLLDALHRCVQTGEEEPRLCLFPLLEHLQGKSPEEYPEGYEAVRALLSRPDDPELCRHLARVARLLWESPAAAGATFSDAPALAHLFGVAAAATRRPERALEAMRAATGADRYRASISVELMEQWLSPPVAEIVLPVLEATMAPAVAAEVAQKALARLVKLEEHPPEERQ